MKGAVIYISSNREKPEFEEKIIKDMLSKKGDLPVFSVSQKPMDLGTNKCVGDVGTSGFNFCRQLEMVIEMADVDYVVSCEADCLYSPDYFKFVPPKLDRVYRKEPDSFSGCWERFLVKQAKVSAKRPAAVEHRDEKLSKRDRQAVP